MRGQYDGYLDIDGVADGSTTETFIALRLYIDNWRWHQVPFYIRAGKKLATKQTELRLVFREPPPVNLNLGLGDTGQPTRDQFVIKLDPTTGARLVMDARRGDQEGPAAVTLDVDFAEQGGEAPTPYEVLLHAASVGDTSRFKRQVTVDECWRVMQPLLDSPPPVHPYEPGTWGPDAANELVAEHGGWQGPWLYRPTAYGRVERFGGCWTRQTTRSRTLVTETCCCDGRRVSCRRYGGACRSPPVGAGSRLEVPAHVRRR